MPSNDAKLCQARKLEITPRKDKLLGLKIEFYFVIKMNIMT